MQHNDSSSSSLGENTGIILDPGEPENKTKAHNLTMGDPRDMAIDFNFKNTSNIELDNNNETQFVCSWNEDACRINKEEELSKFTPVELIGRSFLVCLEEGQRVKSQVIRKLNDWDSQNHQNIKFLLK